MIDEKNLKFAIFLWSLGWLLLATCVGAFWGVCFAAVAALWFHNAIFLLYGAIIGGIIGVLVWLGFWAYVYYDVRRK